MLSLIFTFFMVAFIFRMIKFAFRASWGIIKVLLLIIFFPGIVSTIFFVGLTLLAMPIIVIAFLASLFIPRVI